MSNSKPSSKSTWKTLPSARSVQLFGRLVFVACALIATTIWAWPSSQKGEPSLADSSSAGERLVSVSRDRPPAALDHSTKPIEQIRIGERVLAHNPEVSDEERSTWTEPDWSQWLKLSLVMPKEDGSDLKMELLRSEEWVRSQMALVFDQPDSAPEIDAAPDYGLPEPITPSVDFAQQEISVPLSPIRPIFRDLAMADASIQLSGMELKALLVEMDLPELAITGPAVVTDITPAPLVADSKGRVVTATFHHSSGNVIDLTIGDDTDSETTDSETIGTTSNHPFWSVDRQDYVQAGSLEIGEQVRTYAGDTKQVVSKLPRPGPQAVYNIEVHGEHVYYVGQQGSLVHNSCSFDQLNEYGDAISRMKIHEAKQHIGDLLQTRQISPADAARLRALRVGNKLAKRASGQVLARGDEVFTERQWRRMYQALPASERKPFLRLAYLGKHIETQMRDTIRRIPVLNRHVRYVADRGGTPTPDWIGRSGVLKGTSFDVTTNLQRRTKRGKYPNIVAPTYQSLR